MHCIRPDRPLDADVATILREVARITNEHATDYLIVGATARDILLTHVFGMSVRRATRDIDFAIAVADWEQFERIREALQSTDGFEASETLRQRLYFGRQGGNNGYPIDLIPFGGVEQEHKTIAWPPDMDVIMNVAGFPEALAATEKVEVAKDLMLNVSSLAGLAILKLFAWFDRGLADPKDAFDLYQIMQSYADAGNLDRLYEAESGILEAADYDADLAGTCLLGKDAANLASQDSYVRLVSILDNEAERLTTDMVRSMRHAEDAQTEVERRLAHFKAGMMMREFT